MANEDTGNGASITFGTTGFTANFESFNLGEIALGDIEDSHLGTTDQKTFRPEDLEDPGEVTGEAQFSSSTAIPARGTVETVTVTLPLPSGLTTAATYAGTAYIKTFTMPTLENNALQKSTIAVKWDGKTGPTFTPAS